MRSLLKLFPLIAAASLSACSALDRIHNIGEAPAMQPVGNPAGTQIVAAIPAPKPIMHVDNSLWQPGAQSFFHDPRAMHVGDVITVNVSVADTAKLQNSTSRSRTNSEDANL
ncbi:MAG TPA: flagellar basal body L-ring protein FlgH, partial [Rhizomicrobium sp.]